MSKIITLTIVEDSHNPSGEGKALAMRSTGTDQLDLVMFQSLCRSALYELFGLHAYRLSILPRESSNVQT